MYPLELLEALADVEGEIDEYTISRSLQEGEEGEKTRDYVNMVDQ